MIYLVQEMTERDTDAEFNPPLPTRRISLEGFFKGELVWVVHAIAKKYYSCKRCYLGIGIGEEHAVVRGSSKDHTGRSHHHYCMDCVKNHVSPDLEYLKEISAAKTTPARVGKLTRRKRNSR